jgi:glutaredoxin
VLFIFSNRLRFFTKSDCTLCAKAKDEVLKAQKIINFELEEIDIMQEENQQWHDRYVFDIPVISLMEKELFRHSISSNALIQVLKQKNHK